MITDLALLRLLQLVSPGLPIGMYSYSQGLESTIEENLVSNVTQAEQWISGLLVNCIARVDLPIAARLYDAWAIDNTESINHWSTVLIACRESSELRDEDRQTGQALARLLTDMDITEANSWKRNPNTTLVTLYTLAAVNWNIPKQQALTGLLWSWLENQVLCAVKLVPLGQVAGQRLLFNLSAAIPELIKQGLQLDDDDIGGSVFGLALASSRHEMQYSRLFRS